MAKKKIVKKVESRKGLDPDSLAAKTSTAKKDRKPEFSKDPKKKETKSRVEKVVAPDKYESCVAKLNLPARNISNGEKCLYAEKDGVFFVKKAEGQPSLPGRFNPKLFKQYFKV